MKFAPGRPARTLLVVALPPLLPPSVAHAYLDRGAGSYVVQFSIDTWLGGLFALGVFWRRVVSSLMLRSRQR